MDGGCSGGARPRQDHAGVAEGDQEGVPADRLVDGFVGQAGLPAAEAVVDDVEDLRLSCLGFAGEDVQRPGAETEDPGSGPAVSVVEGQGE